MAVKVYFGGTGDGKTSGVMRQEIVPALRRGQRVCHNIEGVDPGRLAEYCGPNVTPDMIRAYSDEQLSQADFWPAFVGLGRNGVRLYDDAHSVFKKGDLLVVDEARQFFGYKTVDGYRERALEYHRHWAADDTKLVSDIVLICQTYGDLAKKARDLAKKVYGWQKQTDIGRDHCSWRREYASPGDALPKKAPIRETVEFDPEIFELYASHGTPGAVQTETGGKTVWQTPKFRKIVAVFVVCAAGGVGLFAWAFAGFGKAGSPREADSSEPPPTNAPESRRPAEAAAERIRIAGLIHEDGRAKILLERDGEFEVIDSADFVVTAGRIEGIVDGVQVQWP
ncbi:MAG: zonular occludens toxin domain-containing protein [Brevundimonas sp.]|uniref:zonular occludens toxin domain-containing protein n=1 Tax=Brevundimonas sp. TaxID=1871086 RepID=UPI00391C4393